MVLVSNLIKSLGESEEDTEGDGYPFYPLSTNTEEESSTFFPATEDVTALKSKLVKQKKYNDAKPMV